MSDYFSSDLWIEIILKLPIKSLIRFIAVCKSWKFLITSPNFISDAESHTLLRRYDKHGHYSLLEFTGKKGSFGIKSCSEFEIPFKVQFGYFRIVGYCDGLVCSTDDFLLFPSQSIILWCLVLLNGIVHWLGYEPIDDDVCRGLILAFEIGNEVFGEVMLPDLLARKAVMSLHLFTIGGSLAVVRRGASDVDEGCDVWIMKEYGVKESWTKLYMIDLDQGFERVVSFRNGEVLLACEEGLDLVAYNLETRQSNNLGIYGTPRSFYIDNVASRSRKNRDKGPVHYWGKGLLHKDN
ncbi:hypothetical protein C2S52_006537 [Perilla frutescens var. hirtella]|nr:hypothetical protein C2S52_006537 [Perilla frutescens var. hirtella]